MSWTLVVVHMAILTSALMLSFQERKIKKMGKNMMIFFTNNFEYSSIVRKRSYRYEGKAQKLKPVSFILGIPGNQLNLGVLFLNKARSRPLTISASFSND